MRHALFRYSLCLLPLLLVLSTAKGQEEANRVSFYYAAGGQVYKGSVKMDFSLYRNGSLLSSTQVVDCRGYSYQNFEIRATASNVNWGMADHKDRYKLAFSDEYIMPGDGLQKKSSSSMYLDQAKRSGTMRFGLTNFNELSTSGVILAFFVLDKTATFADIEDSDISDGKVFGFGSYIHPTTLVPSNYREEEEVEIELYDRFFTLFVNSMNSSLEDLSYELAAYIQKGDYSSFERKLAEKGRTSSREVFSSEKTAAAPRRSERTDADYLAFKNASAANTAAAYQTYLNEYPNGQYAATARNQVSELTPFDIQVEERLEGPFKYYTLSFLQGVGDKRPILTLTNNEDWAVKEEWANHKKVSLKLPPERAVTATFSLGRKSKSLDLSHGEHRFPDSTADTPVQPELPPEPPADRSGGSRIAFAVLLAIPFLGAIGYLLHKKHR